MAAPAQPEQQASAGWPWFVWALITAAVIALSVALVYAFISLFAQKKHKKQRHRSVKTLELTPGLTPPVQQAPAVVPSPVVTTAVPMPQCFYEAPRPPQIQTAGAPAA